MKKTVTQKELNAMGCGNPNCRDDHSILYKHSSCHPGAGLDAMYSKPAGTMHLICANAKRRSFASRWRVKRILGLHLMRFIR
jgi:hypothetical protein